MKKISLFAIFSLIVACCFAQSNEPYAFKEYKRLNATEVKSQDQTGTCWAERLGKGKNLNLSEMFVVRHVYRDKCENFIRRQGKAQFGEGGLAHDLLNAVKKYGITPENEYPGRKDINAPYNHSELEKMLKSKCDELVAQAGKGNLKAGWISEIDRILDNEFGTVPVKFVVGGTVFTPTSYRDFLGLVPDDYVTVTSFNHHPFNETFILEIPDNWANGTFYNLPLNEMMRCLNNAIRQGYSVEWDADVSNRGFSPANGIAIVPEIDWKDKDASAQSNAFKFWEPERQISQDYRQEQFDRQIVMDDHLMHITGIMNEEHGGVFYSVKNSWGKTSRFEGYVYCSESYLRLNTISFTVHKSAIPADIRKIVGLEEGDVFIERTKNEGNTPAKANLDARQMRLKAVEKTAPSAQPDKKSGGKTSNN
jgi:bleomycin hydrolase